MIVGGASLLALLVCARAEKWQWPEGAASVRIDTKVRFIDDAPKDHKNSHNDQEVQSDEPQFAEPVNAEGYYHDRSPGARRYPVRVEEHRAPYKVEDHGVYDTRKSPHYYSDGTLDSLQYCKCVFTPECSPAFDSSKACGVGKFLCCFKRTNKNSPRDSEYFNEVEDERTVLLPNQGMRAGPFPTPPGTGMFGPIQQQPAYIDPHRPSNIAPNKPILVGPDGPTGLIGPPQKQHVLGSPHGAIGPGSNRGVLVGPEGPTGLIGPQQNRDVLVGPGGPTGIIGPVVNKPDLSYLNEDSRESAQGVRPVLVGPGGPTGIIGPAGRGYGRRPVLVGPGGPTGIIGPYGRQNPGVLVGPGGPTGVIGPRRRPFYYYGK